MDIPHRQAISAGTASAMSVLSVVALTTVEREIVLLSDSQPGAKHYT